MNKLKLRVLGLFLAGLIFTACKKDVIYIEPVAVEVDLVQARMMSFSVKSADNVDFINDNIEFSIQDSLIVGRVPFYTNLKKLVVSFQSDADSVLVGGVPQVSGETLNDFSKPLVYQLINGKGKPKSYQVKLVNFTGLPVIKIYTEGSAAIKSKDVYLKADISVDGAGEYPDFNGKMKIKGRGNSTWTFPKKPYKIKFDNKQGLLGEKADKEWVLLANYNDKSALRTDAAYFLGSQSNLDWTPKGKFVELFVNDVYLGTYQLAEGVNVSESRVNVSDDGYLLEVDQFSRMEAGDVYFTTKRILVNIKEPGLVLNDTKFNYIKKYVADAENALYGENFLDPENGYRKYLDVGSFVDWYLINEIAKNNDAVFYSSCYMNMKPGGKLKMGPVWDFDIAFGNVNYNQNQDVQGFHIRQSQWINRLFQDPQFVTAVKTRFAYFKSRKSALLENINKKSVMLKWSATENNNKWNTFYNNIHPNYAVMGSYDNEVQYLKSWINKRFDWLDAEFTKM